MMTLHLDLPPRELSPNARVHWRVKAAAVARYRKAVALWAMSLWSGRPPADEIDVRITWYHPARGRHPDPDNCVAMLKPAMDGLQDARVVVNDRRVRWHPVEFAHAAQCDPHVQMCITPTWRKAAA